MITIPDELYMIETAITKSLSLKQRFIKDNETV